MSVTILERIEGIIHRHIEEGDGDCMTAAEATARVLLEALRAFNVKTSDGKPRQWLGSEAELNGALLNDFERQIGLTAQEPADERT